MTVATEDRGVLPDDVPIGTVLDRTCASCDTDYQWTSREGYQWPTNYCSKTCKRREQRRRQPHRRMKLDESADITAAQADGMVLLICERCWTPFGWVPPSEDEACGNHQEPPRYHSLTCRDAGRKSRRKEIVRREQEDREARRKARAITAVQEKRRRDEEEYAARVAAESAAARELLLPAALCRVCGKVASPTEQAAKDTKRAIEQRSGRTNEVRYYQCDDGWWHWTRMGADLETWRAERLMTESPASLRHRGRGGWTVPQ